MAVTEPQQWSRQGRDGKIRQVPVAAAKKIPEGTVAFLDAAGFATDEKVDANTKFLGFARATYDNTGGANGDVVAEFWTDGDFQIDTTGLVDTDRGGDMHASDNFTFTKTATANPKIGTITEILSATRCAVSIRGYGEYV